VLSLPLIPKRQQAAKLDDRLLMVIDAQVADAVDAFTESLRGSDLLNLGVDGKHLIERARRIRASSDGTEGCLVST
jgi:hypothetical protein